MSKNLKARGALAAAWYGALAVAFGVLIAGAQAVARPFSVRDDITMRLPLTEVQFSPNGRYFYILTMRGSLAENLPQYTAWIWSTEDVRRFLRGSPSSSPPRPISIALTSSYKEGPMNGIRLYWLDDSSGFAYVTLNAKGLYQLYHVDLKTRAIDALTPVDRNVTGYAFQGRNYVYSLTSPEIRSSEAPKPAAEARDVTGRSLDELLFPADPDELRSNEFSELWAVIGGRRFRVEDKLNHEPVHVYSPQSDYSTEPYFGLSPDGRSLIVVQPVADVPLQWKQYATPTGYQSERALFEFGVTRRFRASDSAEEQQNKLWMSSYQRLELSSGRFSPLVDAPTGKLFDWNSEYYTPRWSADGQALLLSNTFRPLNVKDPRERTDNARHPCVAVFEVRNRRLSCLLPIIAGFDKHRFGVEEARFDPNDRHRVIINFDPYEWLPGGRPVAVFREDAQGQWHEEREGKDPLLQQIPIEAKVQQDLNHRPVLVASDKVHSSRELWDPNPQLSDVDWGHVELISWKDKTGWEYHADLIKPPGFSAGKRYPLLIQTHGYIPSGFLTSGATTSFVAQECASAGIVVVQMGWNGSHIGEAQEVPDQVEGFASLVDKLDGEGVIDPEKVGLMGWSRSVYHTYGALVANRPRLAAASVIEGANYGYWNYLGSTDANSRNAGSVPSQALHMIGARPSGPGLTHWMQRSLMFNLDQVREPLLMLETGAESLLGDWEPYAQLYSLGKPVDLMLLPEGTHVQTTPQQRLLTQQLNLDWFRFWLEGEEDSDPRKAEQYSRWRQLRALEHGVKSP